VWFNQVIIQTTIRISHGRSIEALWAAMHICNVKLAKANSVHNTVCHIRTDEWIKTQWSVNHHPRTPTSITNSNTPTNSAEHVHYYLHHRHRNAHVCGAQCRMHYGLAQWLHSTKCNGVQHVVGGVVNGEQVATKESVESCITANSNGHKCVCMCTGTINQQSM